MTRTQLPEGQEGKGCSNEVNLWSHFAHCRPQDKVRIRGLCSPKCRLYELQTRAAGSARHERSDQCQKLAAHRQRQRLAEEVEAAEQRKFTVYHNDTLRLVEVFKYLGRVIARGNCNTPAIRRKIKRARQVWRRISKVITKEEVPPKVAGMVYQAVVVAILLYGSETWCLTDTTQRPLDGFHVEAHGTLQIKCRKRLRGGRVHSGSTRTPLMCWRWGCTRSAVASIGGGRGEGIYGRLR